MAPRNIERRQFPRFPHKVDVIMTELPQVGTEAAAAEKEVRAKARDVSRGGICVVSDEAISSVSLIRCELALPGFPVPVPTMMQTRWTRTDRHGKCVTGLQFLL